VKLATTVACVSLLLFSVSASAKVEIFACEPEWKALAEALGGEHVSAFSATTAFQDPHYVEARPSLIAKARQANMLVCTGAELEVGWLPLLLRQSGNPSIQQNQAGYFLATEQVNLIEKPTQFDRSQGDVHAAGNPHVHLEPYRLLIIAKALKERLMVVDANNKESYQANFEQFEKMWQSQISIWEVQAAPLKGKKAIVYHKNWSYLMSWLGITPIGDLEPKPGIPPTSAHLSSLLNTVRTTGADTIIVANYQNDKGAQWLSGKTHIPIVILPFTVGGGEKATDLVSLYNEILSRLNSSIKQ